MATDPFRLRVLKALTALLKTITPANGYVSDLSDVNTGKGGMKPRVYRGVTRFGEGHKLPMVSVLEHPAALDMMLANDGGQDGKGDWVLLIQGFVKDDPENPTDPAHVLVADVMKAIATQDGRPGSPSQRNVLGLGYRESCITKIQIGQPVVRPADGEISDQAFFWLTLTLTLVEDLGKPYADPN